MWNINSSHELFKSQRTRHSECPGVARSPTREHRGPFDGNEHPLSTIKRRLCGKSPFTLEEIEQIAKHFNVAASKLLSPIFMSESREAALADGGEE